MIDAGEIGRMTLISLSILTLFVLEFRSKVAKL